jgi:hypothetical protein
MRTQNLCVGTKTSVEYECLKDGEVFVSRFDSSSMKEDSEEKEQEIVDFANKFCQLAYTLILLEPGLKKLVSRPAPTPSLIEVCSRPNFS